jgi:hypothetical protein
MHQTSDLVLRLHQNSVVCMAPSKASTRRVRVTISIDPLLLKWVQDQVGVGKRFRSTAHAIEDAVGFYKQHQSEWR